MKFKSLTAIVLGTTLLTACGGKEQQPPTAEQALSMTQAELVQALADQDSLLSLMNEIQGNMEQIKQMENILNAPQTTSPEVADRRQEIKDDIASIQNELEARRLKLEKLERRLRDSNNQNRTLTQSIETLKAQIANQESTIASLQTSLAQANAQIAGLNNDIDSLNTTVAIVNEQRQQAEDQNNRLTNELNTCYYALGTKDELKAHKLIETGFLRRTKVLPNDFETSYFTAADKRTLSLLPLHTKKAKVLTSQPVDTYTIVEDATGNKSLRIENPARFWEVSNFLVIQTD